VQERKIVVVLLTLIVLYLLLEPVASYTWGQMLPFRSVESAIGEAGIRALHLLPALALGIVGGIVLGVFAQKRWALSIFCVVVASHRFFAYPGVVAVTADATYIGFAAAEGLCLTSAIIAAYVVAKRRSGAWSSPEKLDHSE